MRIRGHLLLPIVAAGTLLCGSMSSGSVAAAPVQARQANKAVMEPVIINVTTTQRVVRGRVTTDYLYGGKHIQTTCVRAQCRFRVPEGVRLFITETAKDPYRWHFRYWKVTEVIVTKVGKTKPVAGQETLFLTGSSTGFTVTSAYTIGAEFVKVRR